MSRADRPEAHEGRPAAVQALRRPRGARCQPAFLPLRSPSVLERTHLAHHHHGAHTARCVAPAAGCSDLARAQQPRMLVAAPARKTMCASPTPRSRVRPWRHARRYVPGTALSCDVLTRAIQPRPGDTTRQQGRTRSSGCLLHAVRHHLASGVNAARECRASAVSERTRVCVSASVAARGVFAFSRAPPSWRFTRCQARLLQPRMPSFSSRLAAQRPRQRPPRRSQRHQ